MERYRLGLLGVNTTSDYPRSVRMGIKNAVEEAGHTLIHISELIPAQAEGLICRLGGDEFLAFVCLPSAGAINDLTSLVQKAVNRFNEKYDKSYKLAISSGATFFTIDEQTPGRVEDLMVEADEELYKMKRKRKGSRRFEE